MNGAGAPGDESRGDRVAVVAAGALLAALYLTSLHSYLLFHTLSEIVFVVVCLSVFLMAWSLREFLDDDFAVCLGILLLFVAGLHVVHIIDYPGLWLLSGSNDPPTQIWLGARFLLAGSFIFVTFLIGRRVHVWLVVLAAAVYCAVVLSAVYWWQVFPTTLTADDGLTPFKKVAEYGLCLLFASAIVLVWRRRDRLPRQTWRLLLAALLATIVSELFFTLYESVDAWPNLLGHLFLVLSAVLLFRAVVDDGLARPHAIAMSNLREAEEMHQRLEQALVPTVPLEHEGLEVVVHYRPSERHLALSGDFIDVLDAGVAGVAVICGDVSGHGPNAAAMGAMLRASWQALTDSGADAPVIVHSLTRVLERERRNPLTFATVCLAWVDPKRSEITLLSLGHPAPLLLGNDVMPLAAVPAPPIGSVDWPAEEPLTVRLPADGTLFFYTDGLIEGRVAPGSPERFGERRLIEVVRGRLRDRIDETWLRELVADVESRCGGFDDDVTAMVLSLTGSARASSQERGAHVALFSSET